jgi:thymidylate kinase
MLITFEGQDGAGKTAVLTAVHDSLVQLGIDSTVVEEFSDSPYGQAMIDALGRDKFLRPRAGEPATHRIRALEEVIDLYYLDQKVIGPALDRGRIVLKDRHLDTILCALVPTLCDSGTLPDDATAMVWLRATLAQLTHRPDLTVYVDAPLDTRVRRIEARQRDLVEANGRFVSDSDVAVFVQREEIARRLILDDPDRFLLLRNDDDCAITESAREVVAAIRAMINPRLRAGAQR